VQPDQVVEAEPVELDLLQQARVDQYLQGDGHLVLGQPGHRGRYADPEVGRGKPAQQAIQLGCVGLEVAVGPVEQRRHGVLRAAGVRQRGQP
jgi:hypothetical protein